MTDESLSAYRGRIVNRLEYHLRQYLITHDFMVSVLLYLYEVQGNVIPMDVLRQMDIDREAAKGQLV